MTVTANSEVIDQRPEIRANDIEIIVRMPGGQETVVKIDASAPDFTSTDDVVAAAADLLKKLLEA